MPSSLFDPVSFDESLLTGGLESAYPDGSGVIAGGMPVIATPAPPFPNVSETVHVTAPYPISPDTTTILDANGVLIEPQSYGPIDLGNGAFLHFNPLTQTGSVSTQLPSLDPHNAYNTPHTSYTGQNLRVMIESGIGNINTDSRSKQLLELSTLTVSVHRVKAAATACGYFNPKGFARGRRTIAGTMVLTKFTADVMVDFLQSGAFTSDLSKDTVYMKVDQLPPFNMTLLFADEYGHASSQRLLGVEFVTSGDVYSIQDMLSEQTVTYMAADFTPLMPLSMARFYESANAGQQTARERTVQDLWSPAVGGLV